VRGSPAKLHQFSDYSRTFIIGTALRDVSRKMSSYRHLNRQVHSWDAGKSGLQARRPELFGSLPGVRQFCGHCRLR
jgi:hypothetical protein